MVIGGVGGDLAKEEALDPALRYRNRKVRTSRPSSMHRQAPALPFSDSIYPSIVEVEQGGFHR